MYSSAKFLSPMMKVGLPLPGWSLDELPPPLLLELPPPPEPPLDELSFELEPQAATVSARATVSNNNSTRGIRLDWCIVSSSGVMGRQASATASAATGTRRVMPNTDGTRPATRRPRG